MLMYSFLSGVLVHYHLKSIVYLWYVKSRNEVENALGKMHHTIHHTFASSRSCDDRAANAKYALCKRDT